MISSPTDSQLTNKSPVMIGGRTDSKSPDKLSDLQRDLNTSANNSIAMVDAKDLKQRAELETACKIRLELLEKDLKSTQVNIEELSKGWQTRDQNQTAVPQELEKALKSQQQLCSVVLKEKKQLVDGLRQEIKRRNELHDKTLKENAKQIELLMERHKHQMDVLTRAYQQELRDTENAYMKEFETLHSEDKMRLEEGLKTLNDKEEMIKSLTRETLDQCQVKIKEEVMKTCDDILMELKQLKEWQKGERKKKIMASKLVAKETILEYIERETSIQAKLRKQLLSLRSEIKDLKGKLTDEDKDFTKKNQPLLHDYKRFLNRYERLQDQVKHFARADARQFEEVWRTTESEVKLWVKKALEIDSLICNQLGLVWDPPLMAFLEVCGPIRPHKKPPPEQLFLTASAVRVLPPPSPATPPDPEASAGLSLETTDSLHRETDQEGEEVHVGSSAELEEEQKILQNVVALLCDEAGFLITDILLNILTSLDEEVQTGVKLASLLCTLGIEEKDVPRLTLFLLNYERQQREQSEDVSFGDDTEEAEKMAAEHHVTSELIDRNNILLALKSFLEQERRSSSIEQSSARVLGEDDPAAVEAFWESLGNVISEDKLKLWHAAEGQLRKCQVLLTDMCNITCETEVVEQQNTELRKLLQDHQQYVQYPGANVFE